MVNAIAERPVDLHRLRHITLFMHSLSSGGGTCVMLNLAKAFLARGLKVDLVLAAKLEGKNAHNIPAGARAIELEPSSRWRSGLLAWQTDREGAGVMRLPVLLPLLPPRATLHLPSLVEYLKQEQPDALIAEGKYCNVTALWARRAADVPTRILITEHIAILARLADPANARQWKWRYAAPLFRRVYPWADAIISVSQGVGDELAQLTRLPRPAITTIYNPIISDDLYAKAREPIAHPWFKPGSPPVILSVGRVVPRKDFSTLLRAFARLRAQRAARLVILGDTKSEGHRRDLLSLASELGIADHVDLPGHTENPFAYMARSALLVLSSRWEGLSNVIVEALACGCPVVSTDCPHGPSEILDGGRYGSLVPVGDDRALALAMAECMNDPPDPNRLRRRAGEFSIDRAAEQYLRLAHRLRFCRYSAVGSNQISHSR